MTRIAIKNGKCYLSNQGIEDCDIVLEDGKITSITKTAKGEFDKTLDASGNLVIPGAIDSHTQIGIYRNFEEDAKSESRSAAYGGITSILSYFRTGRNYFNKTGSYKEIFPEILSKSDNNFYTNYGFNIGPNTEEQLNDIEYLVNKGVTTYKFYMFYKGLNLRSQTTNTSVENEYLLSPDKYDLGYLWKLMSKIASFKNNQIRLSVHAEEAEIIRDFINKAKEDYHSGLENETEAYSEARPPESEYVAVYEALSMASLLNCPINILHVSSEKAMHAIEENRKIHPDIDVMVEVTASHITLENSMSIGVGGKVNPPIRKNTDVEYLWQSIENNGVQTISSDHAAISSKDKGDELWNAENGYGATELLIPAVINEGYYKRNISLDKLIPLITYNQAKYHGMLRSKGSISIGKDADITIIDLKTEKKVRATDLHSAQDFTPFEGLTLKGWPTTTIVSGNIVIQDGELVSEPKGKFIKRPLKNPSDDTSL